MRNACTSENSLCCRAAHGVYLDKLQGVIGSRLHHCAAEDKAAAVRLVLEFGAEEEEALLQS